jgi:hypothetical protein
MKQLLPIALLAVLIISGCSSPEKKLAGSFSGTIEFTEEGKNQVIAMMKQLQAPQAEIDKATKDMDGTQVTLDLKEDLSFTLNSGGLPGVTGTWTLNEDGSTAVLKPEVAGTLNLPNSGNQTMEFTISDDNKSLTLTGDARQIGMSIKLNK